MELYQLKSFVSVAEEGNLTRAAERLFSSQPAVSARIKALEEELGVALFDRTARGMILTQAGEALLEKAGEVLGKAGELNELARSLQAAPTGSLAIGVNQGGGYPLDIVSELLTEQCPGLSLEFMHGGSGVVMKGVLNGDLDVGFAEGLIESPLIDAKRIGEVKAVVIASPKFKDAFEADDWEGLQELPWVMKTPDCSYYQLMERVVKARNLQWDRRFVVDDDGTTEQFVRRGVGISLVNPALVADDIASGALIVWKGFEATLPVHVLCLAKRRQEQAIQAFFKAVEDAYAQ